MLSSNRMNVRGSIWTSVLLVLLATMPGWSRAEAPGLPEEPPIPGIPGQKAELPPALPFVLTEAPDRVTIAGGGLEISVTLEPFSVRVIRQQDRKPLLISGRGPSFTGFAPIAFTRDHGFTWNRFYWGYRGFCSIKEPWVHTAEATRYWAAEDRVFFEVRTDRPGRGPVLFVVGPFYERAVRLATAVPPGNATFDRLAFTFYAPPDEHYAGFGERFNGVDQRGKALETWSEEGSIEPGYLRVLFPHKPAEFAIPGGEDASYAPIPFFLSSSGYGFLADVPHPTHFDMARTFPNLWRIEVEANQLSAVVFAGPTPADALRQYTERTGRSLIPRPWVFAPWNQFLGYPQGGPLKVARIFRDKDIPSSVSHVWTAILPVASYRGNGEGVVSRNAAFHGLGYKSLCYILPRVDAFQCKELWREAADLGHFIRDPKGNPYIFFVALNLIGQSRFRVSKVDFTHEGVDAWWHKRLQTIVDLGFDGTMYDFGEYVPPDAQFADGHDGHYWHNPYNLIYLRSAFRFFQKLDDDPTDAVAPDYVYFHRSGYAGSQQWAWGMWDGDPEADWSPSDGLPAQVCAGINLGLSGIPFWGSDIGGFHAVLVPPPTSELHKRWVEFGAFSGLMRDMTAGQIVRGKRIHVLDEDELTYIVRRYQKLRTQLVPYIHNSAREAHTTGLPLMRAVFLHFPQDPKCWQLRREYLFGPDLYVAPVVEKDARTRTLYLPQGQWVELWDRSEYDGTVDGGGTGGFRIGGVPIEGGRDITVEAPIDEIPVFVRLGGIIPVADPSIDTWAPANPPEAIEVTTAADRAHLLHVWAFPAGTSATTLSDGTRLEVRAEADGVTLARTGPDDEAELVAQVVWPDGLTRPHHIEAMVMTPNGDPLTLPPGAWTWHEARNAVALHGAPGRNHFAIRIAAE